MHSTDQYFMDASLRTLMVEFFEFNTIVAAGPGGPFVRVVEVVALVFMVEARCQRELISELGATFTFKNTSNLPPALIAFRPLHRTSTDTTAQTPPFLPHAPRRSHSASSG